MSAVFWVALGIVSVAAGAYLIYDSRPRWRRQAVRVAGYWLLGLALIATVRRLPAVVDAGALVAMVIIWHVSGRWAAAGRPS